MARERVLVTGGAGFIGSHVVDKLLAAGHEVAVLDNLSSGKRENLPAGVALYEADIRDVDALARIFAEVRPRLVCHQAAQISVSRSVREPSLDADVNVVGFLRVLEQAVRSEAERVVFASSGGVLYGDVFSPAGEDSPANPISPYGIAKWVGERYLEFFARQYGLQGVALRYANVYGPRQDASGEAGVVAIFSERLLAGEPPVIHGDGANVRDYVYVEDVARANLLALTQPVADRYLAVNIGTGTGTDVNTLEGHLRAAVAAALERAGAAEEAAALPPAQHGPARPGDLRSSLISFQKAQQALGWQPQVSLPDGLRTTADWFVKRARSQAGTA